MSAPPPTAAAPSGTVYGSTSLKVPPRWDPGTASTYPFRKWVQDVMLWSMVTDLPINQQAPAVVLQQTGTVRDILRAIDVNVLANGGPVDMMDGRGPVMQTGLTIVLYVMSQKFLPLGYEQNVQAAQAYLGFQRMSGETIDAALCRYATARFRANEEANLNLGPTGTAYHLLRALRVSPQMWTLLLQPFGGNMPTQEQELIQMEEHLRRQGHLLEGVMNQSPQQGAHFADGGLGSFFAEPGGCAPSVPQGAAASGGYFPCSAAAAPAMAGSGTGWPEPHPGMECEACGMYVYDEDDDGSSSATSGEGPPPDHEQQDYSNQEANELHQAYVLARRKWRHFTGKHTRAARRPARKGSGKSRSWGKQPGKGKSGKGLGFGKHGGIYHSSAGSNSAYFGGKTRGRGKKNPLGKDGKPLRCHQCDSDEHLVAHCPKRPKTFHYADGAAPAAPPADQTQQIQRMMSGGVVEGCAARQFMGACGYHQPVAATSLGMFFTQAQHMVLNSQMQQSSPSWGMVGQPASPAGQQQQPLQLQDKGPADAEPPRERVCGRVKKYNDKERWGIIVPSGGGKDIFIHASNVSGPSLSAGAEVTYEVDWDDRRGRPQAVACRLDRGRSAHSDGEDPWVRGDPWGGSAAAAPQSQPPGCLAMAENIAAAPGCPASAGLAPAFELSAQWSAGSVPAPCALSSSDMSGSAPAFASHLAHQSFITPSSQPPLRQAALHPCLHVVDGAGSAPALGASGGETIPAQRSEMAPGGATTGQAPAQRDEKPIASEGAGSEPALARVSASGNAIHHAATLSSSPMMAGSAPASESMSYVGHGVAMMGGSVPPPSMPPLAQGIAGLVPAPTPFVGQGIAGSVPAPKPVLAHGLAGLVPAAPAGSAPASLATVAQSWQRPGSVPGPLVDHQSGLDPAGVGVGQPGLVPGVGALQPGLVPGVGVGQPGLVPGLSLAGSPAPGAGFAPQPQLQRDQHQGRRANRSHDDQADRAQQMHAISSILRPRTPQHYYPWGPRMVELDISMNGGGGDAEYWHSRARLKGQDREGLLIDPGAHDNLTGDAWVHRVQAILKKHNMDVDEVTMDRSLTVEGVGAGSQECATKTLVPMILETGDTGTYQSPVIPNSDVPALLGNKTLERRRSLIDTFNHKLYFVGPGDYEIKLPPGSLTLDLEKTESGHLLLPITAFDSISKPTSKHTEHTQQQQSTSQFPVVQGEHMTTSPTTPCTGVSAAPACSGNAAGCPHRAEGRASVPPGASRQVRFDDSRELPTPCMLRPSGNAEPAVAHSGAGGSSRGNAAESPHRTGGRAEAPPGSREPLRAGHRHCDEHTTIEQTKGLKNSTSNPNLHLHASASESSLVYLYDDENGIRQSALRDERLRTHNVQMRRNYSHDHLRYQLMDIRSQEPDLLWMRLTGCKTPRGDRHDERQSRSMLTLINTQLDQGRHVLIEGNLRDYAWDLPGMMAMRADKRLNHSQHLWCNYGVVDPDTDTPIHRNTLVLSSFPLPDRSVCKCTSPPPSSTSGRTRSSKDIMMLIGFIVDFVRHLLPSFRAASGRPGFSHSKEQGDVPESNTQVKTTTDESDFDDNRIDQTREAFPTDARERQKEQWDMKKKLAAEKGIKAVRNRKPRPEAEQHFDDCGEDFGSIALDGKDFWRFDR